MAVYGATTQRRLCAEPWEWWARGYKPNRVAISRLRWRSNNQVRGPIASFLTPSWTGWRRIRLAPLPASIDALEVHLSISYQATLLREEGRPVTFRLSPSEPDAFAATGGPPASLHRLVFTRPLPPTSTNPKACSRCRVFPIVDRCYGRRWGN